MYCSYCNLIRLVCVTRTQLSLTNRATHLCNCNGMADLLKHAPPRMCCDAKFGRSALKVVAPKYRRTSKIGER